MCQRRAPHFIFSPFRRPTQNLSRFLSAIFVTALFVLSGSAACAVSVVIPPGLSAGDSYRLAFVTSTGTVDGMQALAA